MASAKGRLVASRGRILIVDRDENAREALLDLLRDAGYHVEIAGDASDAVGRHEEFAPHLVLVALDAPAADGMALIETIATSEQRAAVVAMATESDVESLAQAIRRGIAGYLTKPIDPRRLLPLLDGVRERTARPR